MYYFVLGFIKSIYTLGFIHTAMENGESESPLDDCKPVFNEGVNYTTGMVSVKSEPQMFYLDQPHRLEDMWRPSQYNTEVTTFGDVGSEMAEIVAGTEDSKPFGEPQSCLIHGNTHLLE
jgi:hypothetical protein